MNTEKIFRIFTYLGALLGPFAYMFSTIVTRRGGEATDAKRILVVPQLTRLGDVVVATNVLEMYSSERDRKSVTLLLSRKVEGLLDSDPRVEKIIYIEDYKSNPFRLVSDLASMKFDAGVSLSGSPLSSVLFAFSRIPLRAKITKKKPSFTEFCTDYLCQFNNKYVQHTDLSQHYIETAGIFSMAKKTNIRRLVHEEDLSEDGKGNIDLQKTNTNKLVGISIDAGNKVKEWGDDKFFRLVQKILVSTDVEILVLGTKRTSLRVSDFVEKFGSRVKSVTNLTLNDLPLWMSRLDLFVAVDTGPVYVADAVGVTTIDILGPVDPLEQKPMKPDSFLVRPPNTAPSLLMFTPPPSSSVLRASVDVISVDLVFEAFTVWKTGAFSD